jgi:DNA-binding transcriptional MerR regulator/methylmalonyl-CoA mutase cobalamin-binding subunit
VKVQYTVGTVAELCDLSQHTIRAWERRYGAVSPDRSATNRRLYDDEDLNRFRILKKLVDRGHTIGQIAPLPTDALESMLRAESLPGPANALKDPGEFLSEAQNALERLNAPALEDALVSGGAHLGVSVFIESVVIPLIREIETGWTDGKISIYQEHFATAALRTHLDRLRQSLRSPPSAPTIVITTPLNQHHELGALIVSLIAALQNWRAVYLGPNLPASEIAGAVNRLRGQAIGLSIVYPKNDPLLEVELRQIRHLAPAKIPIFVGGSGASSYSATLTEIEATVITNFPDFRLALHRLA